MTIKPLHSKAEHKAALKTVSALVDADPRRGTPEADQLETLGTSIEAYEANEIALTMLDRESRVTLSQPDLAAFSKALGGGFNPNPALKGALAKAKKSVRRG